MKLCTALHALNHFDLQMEGEREREEKTSSRIFHHELEYIQCIRTAMAVVAALSVSQIKINGFQLFRSHFIRFNYIWWNTKNPPSSCVQLTFRSERVRE